MKKLRVISMFIVVALVLCLALPALADSEEATKPYFGILSIIPPVLAIVLAFLTKQVILSLFLGIFAGAIMMNNGNPGLGFLRALDHYMVGSLADAWNAAIIIFTLTIGGMVGIIGKMGGMKAVAESLSKKAKTRRSAQVITSLLGVLVFFDDYANTLIVGPTMRPLTDKLKVSREKLAYIVDSTAAPVVGMALISTWVGYEIGIIKDVFIDLGVEANIYGIFLRTIPYTFYNIFALALVFTIGGTGKDFGPMLKAERRSVLEGKLLADNAKPMASDEITKMEIKEGTKLKARNAILPIITLVLVSFIGLWYNGYTFSEAGTDPFTWEGIRTCFGNADASVVLIWGAVVGSIVAGILAVSQKILSLGQVFDSWVDGAKSLVITGIILVLAWSLGSVTSDVGTADYLVDATKGLLHGGVIPIVVFIISCLVAFSTGTSWGTMAIVVPLAVPLANAFITGDPASSPLVIATLSAVLSGSIFGDHCSPISDTTIMSSMASASDHLDHVKTQAPYSLVGAALAILGYLLVGLFNVPVWITLLLGIVGIIAIVLVFGKDPSKKLIEVKK
ncbi:Na+/H+ antiporter NhaC family protein [Abyssisolibacter fermentans]|uniref:Na+/H+ antiporter NhaC family protein n=1 Tax=Abyssisolibacter fermentans TaxID=1766203 RepID=UPI000AF22139|nr:Na+/H+ antiporter NhaC family protein [Abyssisolibacter fermentans]